VQAELRANVFLAINDQDIAQGGVGKLDTINESNPWPLDPSKAELFGLALSLTLHLLLLQGLAAKAMQHTGWCWLQTHQVIECRPLSAGRPVSLTPATSDSWDLPSSTGVLLLELVREFMQWSNLQFTQQV